MNVTVLVPTQESHLRNIIRKGSAIVVDGDIKVGAIAYFEGNVYEACNIKTFEDKAYHATSRLEHKYPTSAKVYVTDADMLVVGTYSSETGIFSKSDNKTAHTLLDDWLK